MFIFPGLFCGIYLLFLQRGGNKVYSFEEWSQIFSGVWDLLKKHRFLFVSLFLFSGAGRGKEGLVKAQPCAGPQTESQDDQQWRRRQLLLRRHDVTHHHPKCQLVCCQSQSSFLRWRCGVLRWKCWWRVRGQAATPQLPPTAEQPAWIRSQWHWDLPTGAGAEARGDGVWSFCQTCQSWQGKLWLQKSWSISSPNPWDRRSRQLLISERAGDHLVIVLIYVQMSINEVLDSCRTRQMTGRIFQVLPMTTGQTLFVEEDRAMWSKAPDQKFCCFL